MFYEILAVVLLLTMVVIFGQMSGVDSKDYSLLGMVFGFGIFVAITSYFLALTYFSTRPRDLLMFLTFFITVILLPMTLFSTALSAVNVSNLRQAIATGA
jgi:hypothetical protein